MKKGRPKKIDSPVRFSVYLPRENLKQLAEIADLYGEEKADLVRRVLRDYIESNKDYVIFRCDCGFVLKTLKPNKEVDALVARHKNECVVFKRKKQPAREG